MRWWRRRRETEETDPALEREYAAVMADVRAAGVGVRHLMDLPQVDAGPALPALRGWLERAENAELAGEILTHVTAAGTDAELVDALLREYARLDRPESYRWQLGSALHDFRDTTIGDRLLPIVTDPRQGSARQMGLIALGRTRLPAARDPLIALLRDEEVVGHAAEGLGYLGDPAAIPALREVSTSADRGWVRSEAVKAIGRLQRAAASRTPTTGVDGPGQ